VIDLAWDATEPDGAVSPSGTTAALLANQDWIQEALSAEHTFPGVLGSTAGQHLSGECGVVIRAVYASLGTPTYESSMGYATDRDSFYYWNGSAWIEADPFEPGTKAFFYQEAAPNGWTIDTAPDDTVVGLTSDGGGALTGTWIINGLTIDHTHTYSEVPYHTHPIYAGIDGVSIYFRWHVGGDLSDVYTTTSNSAGTAPPLTSDTTEASISGDATWRPAYTSAIMCTKD